MASQRTAYAFAVITMQWRNLTGGRRDSATADGLRGTKLIRWQASAGHRDPVGFTVGLPHVATVPLMAISANNA